MSPTPFFVYDETTGRMASVCAACTANEPEPECEFCCLGGPEPEDEDEDRDE